MAQPVSIFISAAEDSADMHGASLVRVAAARYPSWIFHGLAGPRMRVAGVTGIDDFTADAAMLGGALALVQRARRLLLQLDRTWNAQPPDVAVLIDSPELHLPMAELAKRHGARVLYYVAPQTWASRSYRNRRIAQIVDRLACILPFEQEYFRANGVRAEYVGHPLFEWLAREAVENREEPVLASDRPLVALLPGSRAGVVQRVLPLQLDVLAGLRERGMSVAAAVSAASPRRAVQIDQLLRAHRLAGSMPVTITSNNHALLQRADLVLVASGTATLHVAAHRKPMLVLYDAGPLMGGLHRWLGRWLLHTPHLSLVNVLAGERVVPEFMPTVPDPAEVTRTAERLLEDERWRSHMVTRLDEIVTPLEHSEPSERVCAMLAELL